MLQAKRLRLARVTDVTTKSAEVLILADDLIWMSRLAAAVDRAGARSHPARSAEELASLTAAAEGVAVIVDLNGRGYDGVEAVRAAAGAGGRVLAVGQHEDQDLRRAALAAGARRVFSYNKLFSDGPNVVTSLLEGDL
jgi:DNA-binding NarL/FixJ family response regulator